MRLKFPLLPTARLLLGLLVLLLGEVSARREAPPASLFFHGQSVSVAGKGHNAELHKRLAQKDNGHPAGQKRHRSRAHRTVVVKVIPAPQLVMPCAAKPYVDIALQTLLDEHRTSYCGEILPRPPKSC